MKDLLTVVVPFALLIAVMVLFAWFMAHNEAKSYAKFCDQPVTTWDALFLDLRIDECKKPCPPTDVRAEP